MLQQLTAGLQHLIRLTFSLRDASNPEEEEEARLGLKAGGAQA